MRYLQIGRRVRPGHSFQADRYSFTERRRRDERSLSGRLRRWWSSKPPIDRVLACLGLTAAVVFGLIGGVVLGSLAAGYFGP
jgi:hypothetical protein